MPCCIPKKGSEHLRFEIGNKKDYSKDFFLNSFQCKKFYNHEIIVVSNISYIYDLSVTQIFDIFLNY